MHKIKKSLNLDIKNSTNKTFCIHCTIILAYILNTDDRYKIE